jgi:AbrB family looped-hinge helix DNA binding protein
MLSVKVSTKYQIAVPSEARRQLGIQAGDRLDVQIAGDAIVLRRSPERPSDRLRGLSAGRGWFDPDPVTFVRRLRDEWEDMASDRERRLDAGSDDAAPPDRV